MSLQGATPLLSGLATPTVAMTPMEAQQYSSHLATIAAEHLQRAGNSLQGPPLRFPAPQNECEINLQVLLHAAVDTYRQGGTWVALRRRWSRRSVPLARSI